MVLVLVATFAPSALARSNDDELSSTDIADANENGVTNARRTSLTMIMLEAGLRNEGFRGNDCGDSCIIFPCKDGCYCKTYIPLVKSRCVGSCCGTSIL